MDIQKELMTDIMEEAPDAYKHILPAYNTVQNAGMAYGVAEMKPSLPVKG